MFTNLIPFFTNTLVAYVLDVIICMIVSPLFSFFSAKRFIGKPIFRRNQLQAEIVMKRGRWVYVGED